MKAGDIVAIRRDLEPNCYYGSNTVSMPMRKFCGMRAQITFVDDRDGQFRIDLDGGSWWWTRQMIEKWLPLTPDLFFDALMPK